MLLPDRYDKIVRMFFPHFFYFILVIITSCHFAQYLIIHLTIYGSLEEHMPSDVCSINYSMIRFLFNRRVILTSFLRLIANILRCSSILSAYLWLSLLISSSTYGTLRSWCHWWRIKERWQWFWDICFEIFVVFLCLNSKLCPAVGCHKPK